MRVGTTQQLVGLRPPPCVVPPRKPIGFRQRAETRKPPSRHTKTHPDFHCHGKIIVEIKAVEALTKEHRAQLLNYLRLTGCKLGLLVNFGAYPKAVVEQWAN